MSAKASMVLFSREACVVVNAQMQEELTPGYVTMPNIYMTGKHHVVRVFRRNRVPHTSRRVPHTSAVRAGYQHWHAVPVELWPIFG